ALLNKDKFVKVDMNKEEFFKFLSLISAFKDVVIGDEAILVENNFKIIENKTHNLQDYSKINNNLYEIQSKSSKEHLKNDDIEELNPKDWDPW
ncbi:MAG: hypothetical protein ACFFAN_08025, partial [Promethearchaeota archaeon]